ncbi:MAG TPA: glucose dehydrogenase [Porphyromonadaceae bacterium]|jgi:glucose/arabinose dehydrogenase|nr:glucose dehydrogenase [Porphyromonadaceae bacterium]HBL34330.1 glucose dehydrogenase [Porphyromonadaceae bacterium]HBX20207.1 glucose dehydrogenase [Porphyromonadaceae bacterium]
MKTILTFLLCILTASCSGKQTSGEQPESSGKDTLPPVETQKPNTNYQPAFEGQTRIAGSKTTTPYEAEVIARGLSRPWGIALLPDGRLLITEKTGTLRIASATGTLSPQITGLPATEVNQQGGLLGLTVAPDFETSRMVYVVFTEKQPNGNLTAVAKGRLSDDEKRLEKVQVIYRAQPAFESELHYGGRIVFDKGGNLFVTTGERSDLQTRPKAQSLENALGKVIHITIEGRPVADNPFVNEKEALPEIFTYGHRNPQGLAIHPATGDVWISEMGPRGGDELNLIKAGRNYGWPTITYGIEYSGATIGEGITQKEGLEQPVYYWDPVLSPSGMTFYASDAIPEWKNSLFICGLSSKHIARIVIEDNKVVGEERLLADEGQRFRDITEGNDGALYAVTDEGNLYRIRKK